MAPKKPAAKGSKKEEVIDIPKTSLLADGKRTFIIGGWSTNNTFDALADISKLGPDAGDNVILLPGTIPAVKPAAAVAAPTDAAARPNSQPGGGVEVVAAAPVTVTLPAAAPAAAAAPAGGAPTPGPPGPTIIEHTYPAGYVPIRGMVIGGHTAFAPSANAKADDAADEGANEDTAAAKAAEKAALEAAKPDRSVVVTGDVNITGWKAPIVIQPVAPTPVAPAPAPKRAGAKVQVKTEEELPPPPPPAPVVEPKGAAPSTWPSITIAAISFSGTVSVKGAHVTFKKCHFSNAKGVQAAIHQYCKVFFEGCTFAFTATNAVYAFPTAVVSLSKCAFGVDAPSQTAEAHLSSTAIYVDDAQVSVSSCTFERVGHGIVFNDKCASSTVVRSTFDHILTTAIVCGSGNAAELRGNTIKRCGYYGLHFHHGASTRVLANTVAPQVRVDKGANPFLHSNTLAVSIASELRAEAPYMSPVY